MEPRTPATAVWIRSRMLIGVMAASSGAILVRLASEATPWAISAWRLSVAALVLIPIAWMRRPHTLTGRDMLWCFVSGVALTAHFLLWIASLSLTSVASSVVLVSLHPLFVALGSYLLWRERPSRRLALGALLALLGAALIGYGDARMSETTLTGDLLAAGGGVMAAVYFLIGRHVRRSVSAIEYAAAAYAVAALLALVACWVVRSPVLAFSHSTIIVLLLLGLLPQLIGHSTFNWALKHLPATQVSIMILGEPVGSSLLAVAFFCEFPSGLNMVGIATILGGIYWSQRRKEPGHARQR